MRSSKERKMERKRKHKEMSVVRTEKSRARRLANKAKRDEIHAIDPDAKIVIINQVPYIDDIEIDIVNNKIHPVPPVIEPEIIDKDKETMDKYAIGEITAVEPEIEKGKAIDAQVEKERLGVFNPFKWKKK